MESANWSNVTAELPTVSVGSVGGLDFLKGFGIAFLVVDCLLIFSLNPLCLVALYRVNSDTIQATTKLFLASLTASDLGIGALWLVPRTAEVLAGRWLLGGALCAAYGAASSVFIANSVLSLLLLTADRFVAIVHSLHYPRLLTPTRAAVAVGAVWTLGLAVNTACFGVYDAGRSAVSPRAPRTCIWKNPGFRQYAVMSFYAVALTAVLYFYARIVVVARRQARRIAQGNVALVRPRDPGQQQQQQQQQDRRSNLRAAITVLIVHAALVLSWVPALCESVLTTGGDGDEPEPVKVLVDACLICNSWLNVVIYYARNKELRQAMTNILSSLLG